MNKFAVTIYRTESTKMIKNNHKLNLFLIIILIIGNQITSQSAVWTSKAAFGGTTRQFAVGFSIGAKGYIGTGWDQGIGYRNDFWEYDPATNAWSQKANFGGTARILSVGFSVGTKGYICSGQDFISRLKDLWEYNPVTNTWSQKANFGGAARSRAVAFSIGSKGYLGTGYEDNPGTYYSDFWEYDPLTNTWLQKANFAGGARREAVGFSIGNKGYLGTGYNGTINKNDFWQYNPATNVWTQKTDIGTSMWMAIGFAIGSKGYIGLGYGPTNPLKEFWEYDTTANTWTKTMDFGGSARFGACGFSIGLKGYAGTGLDIMSNRTKDIWEFEPSYLFTGNISPSKICVNRSSATPINVPYTLSTNFKTGNIFTAQLSDSSGSFASPITIGTKTDSLAGTISANIPSSIIYGNKYRIRVISSNPSFIGLDNKINLTIKPKPLANFTINDTLQCFNENNFKFVNTSSVVVGTIAQALWNFNDGNTANTFNPIHSYNIDGLFSVNLKIITDSGCADSIAKNVRILASPNASFTASDTSMCFKGNSFIFSNTSSIKTGSYTQKWFMGNGDSSTNTNLIYSYPNYGKFTLMLIAHSNSNCYDTASQSITVEAIPKIGFIINDTTQCFGTNQFIFTDTSSNANSYFWSFGDGYTSTSKKVSHYYDSIKTYNIKLKVFSSSTCYDSLTKKVNVYPTPKASFSIDNDTQCLGNNIFNFSNLSTIATGSFNTLWNFGDGINSNTFNGKHSYTTDKIFHVKALVISDQGCSDSIILPVVVLKSTITLTKTSNNGPVCEGQPIKLFTDTITNATYSWTGPNGFTSGLQNPVISISNASNTGIYEATASLLGCVSYPSTTLLQVKPTPQAQITISDSCNGLFYFNAIKKIGSAPIYSWDGTNFVFNPANGNSTSHQFSHGVYPFKLTMIDGGCVNTFFDSLQYLQITAKLPNDTAVSKNSIVNLKLKLNSTPYNYFVEWRSGSHIFNSDSSIDFSLTITSDTTIVATVYTSASCPVSSDTMHISKSTSINDNEITGLIKILPNPASANVIVSTNNTSLKIKSIKLYNNLGILINQYNNIQSNSFNIKRDFANSGLYFVNIVMMNGEVVNAKLMWK